MQIMGSTQPPPGSILIWRFWPKISVHQLSLGRLLHSQQHSWFGYKNKYWLALVTFVDDGVQLRTRMTQRSGKPTFPCSMSSSFSSLAYIGHQPLVRFCKQHFFNTSGIDRFNIDESANRFSIFKRWWWMPSAWRGSWWLKALWKVQYWWKYKDIFWQIVFKRLPPAWTWTPFESTLPRQNIEEKWKQILKRLRPAWRGSWWARSRQSWACPGCTDVTFVNVNYYHKLF